MRETAILLNLINCLILSGCNGTAGLVIYGHHEDGLYINKDAGKDPKNYKSHKDAAEKHGCLSWQHIQEVQDRLDSCEQNIGVGL